MTVISWRRVLAALGVADEPPDVLPQADLCPKCSANELLIHNDHVLGGEWCMCRSCKFSGDPIELSAAVWQINIAAACQRLDGLGLFSEPLADDEVRSYERPHCLSAAN
jgi:hypothetical protein